MNNDFSFYTIICSLCGKPMNPNDFFHLCKKLTTDENQEASNKKPPEYPLLRNRETIE